MRLQPPVRTVRFRPLKSDAAESISPAAMLWFDFAIEARRPESAWV